MDALRRYDAMRVAFKTFSSADEMQARKALESAKVIGFSESLKINSALSVVRAFLDKLEEWERQHKPG